MKTITLVKLQMKQLLKRKQFYIGLLIGFCMIWLQYTTLDKTTAMTSNSAYLHLTGIEYTGMGTKLYAWIVPIMVGIVASSTYNEAKNSGMMNHILVRMKNKYFLKSTIISSFLLGGLVGIIPLVVEGIILFIQYPMGAMNPNAEIIPISPDNWGYSMFVDWPFVYWLVFLVIMFIFSGLFALMGIVASYFNIKLYVETLVPFIIAFLLMLIDTIFRIHIRLGALIIPVFRSDAGNFIIYLCLSIICYSAVIWLLTKRQSKMDVFI